MTTPDIQQAREWAEWADKKLGVAESHVGALAAAEIIQSLPDQIVDGRRLRQIIDFQGTSISDDARKDLESLLTPPLPTLADLIEAGEDPQQYQWMQADHIEHGRVIITYPGSTYIYYMKTSGLSGGVSPAGADRITPLPDLPRLEWPAQAPRNPETPPAETLNNASSDTPRNPRPEDVPAGEPWLVGIRARNGIQNGQKFFGIRSSGGTWELFDINEGWHSRWGIPSDITLVSRLVQEDKP